MYTFYSWLTVINTPQVNIFSCATYCMSTAITMNAQKHCSNSNRDSSLKDTIVVAA